ERRLGLHDAAVVAGRAGGEPVATPPAAPRTRPEHGHTEPQQAAACRLGRGQHDLHVERPETLRLRGARRKEVVEDALEQLLCRRMHAPEAARDRERLGRQRLGRYLLHDRVRRHVEPALGASQPSIVERTPLRVAKDLVGLEDLAERGGTLGTGPVGMALLRQPAVRVADAERTLSPWNAEDQIVVLHHRGPCPQLSTPWSARKPDPPRRLTRGGASGDGNAMPYVLVEKPRPHVSLITLNRP